MTFSTSRPINFAPDLFESKRNVVFAVAAFSVGYIIITSLYCYAFYTLFLGETYYGASFIGTLGCVSIDWVGWAIISPFLAHKAVKEDIATWSGRLAIIKLLLTATLFLGIGRVAADVILGNDRLVHTLFYYLPRYLFVTAFLIGVGVFYVYKSKSELQIEHLKQLQRQQTKTQEDQTLIVYKGNCRATVRSRDIISITASGNYLELETPDGTFLMRNTMKKVESKLDSESFVRIHRSHIININQLESVSRTRLEANLTNGKALRIGKKYLGSLPHFSG